MMCKLLAIALALRESAAESSLNATRALLSSRLSNPDPTCAKGIEATGPNGAVICCTSGCDKKHGGCGDTVHCDSPKPWKDKKARKHCCIQEITQSQKFCSTYSAPCIISLAPGPPPPPGPRPAPPPRRRASTPRRRDPSPSPSPSPSPGPWPNNIASKATWTCLDLPGENDKNGQQLWMWECNGGNSQRFTQFNGQIVYSGRDGVADEDRPCLDAGDMWTDGMPIQLWQCNGQPQQQWGVDSDVGSVYLSESADASRCLDLAGGSAALGAAVQVWECTGFDNQQWWWS